MNKDEIKKQVEFLKYCLNRRTDQRFRKIVYEIGDDYSIVSLRKNGNVRDLKPIYFIDLDTTGSGFFSDLIRTLSLIYYADYYNLVPVVRYSAGFSYAEDHEVNGTTNPFEYYFEQPGEYDITTLNNAGCVISSRKENAALAGKLNKSGYGYDYSEEYLMEMGRIVDKYIKLNKESKAFVEKEVEKFRNHSVLGVHVRGTDFKRNYKNHPIYIPCTEYLEKAKELFNDGQYDMVYLATDDTEALELFEETFGNKLLYCEDVVRSNENETVMKSDENRDNHHYLLGLEVLRDAYCLSRCQGLVAGVSQVSTAARIFNRSMAPQDRYLDEIILFKGINKKGDVCR